LKAEIIAFSLHSELQAFQPYEGGRDRERDYAFTRKSYIISIWNKIF